MKKVDSINELLKQFEACKKGAADLSSDEDLSLAIMNLISIEEHLFFTGAKTGKKEYFELLNTAREMRKELLAKIVTEPEGEVWCISKHLLAASMRLMEVGTKQLANNNKQEAYKLFDQSYKLYALFWGLNLKLIDGITAQKLEKQIGHSTGKNSLLDRLSAFVKNVVNCCIE